MSSPSPQYKVIMTHAAQEEFLTLVRRGRYSHRGELIRETMKLIAGRIAIDPHLAGEPMYLLRHIKMNVRRTALAPLYIEYGVYVDHPIVIIRRVIELRGE